MRSVVHPLGIGLVLLMTFSVAPAHAAWSSDPTTNLVVAGAAGDQILPKVAPTTDGAVYVSWFDAIANGFDVRVQRIDAAGNLELDPAGVLVADRGFSSVQDYGLDVDAAGDALLAFRDDSGTGTQITAARVSSTGTVLWSTMLTSTTDFVASPKVAGTSDGSAVVAWTQDVTTHVMKLDEDGDPAWLSDVVFTPAMGSYSVNDLHGAGADVIISLVNQTGGFGSPRHIHAQKLDGTGAPLWGADPVIVFDGGSLQFGNFPPFTPDGAGGGVFAWYDAASLALQCSVQRILPDGTEAFAHNGVVVSTNASRVRVSPSVAFDASTGDCVAAWVEQSSNQSQSGLYAQRIDTSGNRLWTDDGAELVSLSSVAVGLVRVEVAATGPFVYWAEAPSFGEDVILGARLDANGAFDVGPFDVSSTPSGKSRLATSLTSDGVAVLAWSDDRSDAGDILAQNVNADGTLGDMSVAVGDGALSVIGGLVGSPWPNPVRAGHAVSIGVLGGDVDVFDVTGRVVRRLTADDRRAGVRWDGCDARGSAVAPGVYRFRSTKGGAGRAVVVVR